MISLCIFSKLKFERELLTRCWYWKGSVWY